MRPLKSCSASLLFSLSLTACGGGSGGAGMGMNPEANLPQNLNGELAGQLVFENYVLDLSTGVSVSLDLLTTAGATTPLSASSNGTEIYSVTDSCRSGRPQGLSFSCVYVRSDQGLVQEKFEIPFEGLIGAPNVSPDGQLIAIETRDILLTNEELLFYRGNGDLVTSLIAPDGFDWLNDGRGIYTRDQNLWITAENLSDFDGYSVLSSFSVEEGKPRDIAVSPDGMQAVFSLENRTLD
ncbi:MAG: hypothetical protein KTR35_15880, partial [Gammaproteobacteria bacterium]|nr:hypothetical protein [Gammaproteobacteria bacterium]